MSGCAALVVCQLTCSIYFECLEVEEEEGLLAVGFFFSIYPTRHTLAYAAARRYVNIFNVHVLYGDVLYQDFLHTNSISTEDRLNTLFNAHTRL